MRPMSLILYVPKNVKAGDLLLQSIRKDISEQVIEMFLSLDELSDRLHRPMPDVRVAVLYAAHHAELMEIMYRVYLLNDLKVVLVLPDSDPDMLEETNILCPQFIAVTESDFRHLGAVLRKMMNQYNRFP